MTQKKIKTKLTKQVESKPVKISAAELSLRVGEVQGLLLDGFSRSYILQYADSKWKIKQRQCDEYIKTASDNIKEVNQATLQENMGIVTANLWKLFREARTAGNISEQHKILMSIAKLKGLEQNVITHIVEDKRELETMSDAELDAILQQEARH